MATWQPVPDGDGKLTVTLDSPDSYYERLCGYCGEPRANGKLHGRAYEGGPLCPDRET